MLCTLAVQLYIGYFAYLCLNLPPACKGYVNLLLQLLKWLGKNLLTLSDNVLIDGGGAHQQLSACVQAGLHAGCIATVTLLLLLY
jgi:hypothetical protein